jgi:hypothetical protein
VVMGELVCDENYLFKLKLVRECRELWVAIDN